MSKLTILHLSDLHHRGSTANDQKIVVEALKRDVACIKRDYSIDLLVFSGDLVQSGSSEMDFEKATLDVLDPLANELALQPGRVVVCPGNHDIDREVVRKQNYIEQGLKQTLRKRDDINNFVDQYSDTNISTNTIPEAFSRMQNFYKKVWHPMAERGANVTPFSAIQKVKINGISVAICIFNSAWRCTGEGGDADRGNLVIGERAIDLAVQKTKEVAVRIAVFHHPFDWLAEDDRTSVEARFHSDFHAFFFGHVHSTLPTFTRSPLGGAIYSQAGCLYSGRDYFNGYSIVSIDVENSTVKIDAREYSDRIRSFIPALGALPEGSVTFDFPFLQGGGGNNLMALIATVRPAIKRLGDDHVRLASDDLNQHDIERHFICPPLSRPRSVAEDEDSEQGEAGAEDITVEELLETDENVILIGPPESGKTSLIHYVALKAVTEPPKTPRLPLRAKFYDFQKGRNSIWRAVRYYANEISDGRINSKLIEDVPILLFVDEVVPSDDKQLEFILNLIKDTPNIRLILVADGNTRLTSVSSKNEDRLSNFSSVVLCELPRSSIRQLSAQWLGANVETEVTNQTFNKVMEHISRSGFPRSGYIVSLVLWTLRRRLSGELINEAVLLENIVEYMLEKMDYRDSLRSEFDFVSKVAVLQELAIFFRSTHSTVTKNTVITKVIEYLEKKGLKYDGGKIVSGFIECGIFSEIDHTVEFRYRRFEEFFTAGYFRDNRSYFKEIISSDDWGNYSRELDIYTSRFRNETSLLEEGLNKIDGTSLPVPRLDGDVLLKYLVGGGNYSLAQSRLAKMKKEPMSARKIDELRDKADASITRRRSALPDGKRNGSERLSVVRAFVSVLEIYTSFIRNIEFADNVDKVKHLDKCFDFWELHIKSLLSGLSDSFVEVREELETDPEVPDQFRDDIVQMSKDVESQVKWLLPRIVSNEIYKKLGSEKLVHLIQGVAECKDNSVLKRILASFILMDIDPICAMDMMSSKSWTDTMSDEWIIGMIESKLHQYYLEQHLTGERRKKFEKFVSTLEARLKGNKFQSDRIKGLVAQRLGKASLLAEVKERGKKT
ncbi:putative MPP superfamily phosphohydrolase [Labrenzia sp. EL_13]|nr:putative MPP superfamily phosphohydrolase [Labrenzia sp. EL_13]